MQVNKELRMSYSRNILMSKLPLFKLKRNVISIRNVWFVKLLEEIFVVLKIVDSK